MNLGFVIVAHDEPEAVSRLVDRLTSQGGIVALHWDARHPVDLSRRLRETLPASQAARVIAAERIEVHWGLWTVVQATLNGLKALERSGGGLDYVTLLSGHDYPLRPLEQMRAFLADHAGIEHIECVDHEKGRWVTDGLHDERWQYRHYFSWGTHPWLFDRCWHLQRHLGLRRKPLPGYKPHFGSQWWTLSWPTLRKVLSASRQPEVRQFFRRTWVPDEMFFQTLVAKVVSPEKISGSGLNFYHFTPQGTPLVFHSDQLDFLARQPHFFARKISPRADRLKGALDELAENRSAAIPPRLPLKKHLGEYPLHAFRARRPSSNRRVIGRGAIPDVGDLERNSRKYQVRVYHRKRGSLTSGRSADNTLRFGELFDTDRIDYGSGREHPLYPAGAPALRDQDPAAFLFDLLQSFPNNTLAFDLALPCPQRLANIIASDAHSEVIFVHSGEHNAAADEIYTHTHGQVRSFTDLAEICRSRGKEPIIENDATPPVASSHLSSRATILRFGDYIVCAGTMPTTILARTNPSDFEYKFPALSEPQAPTATFHREVSFSLDTGGEKNVGVNEINFIHLLWIRDAGRLDLRTDQSSEPEILVNSIKEDQAKFQLGGITDGDGEKLISFMRALGRDDIWTHRMVCEIATLPRYWKSRKIGFSPAAQIAFSAELLSRYPHQAGSFAPTLPAEEVRMAQLLYLLANYGPAGLPPSLQDVKYASEAAVEPALLNAELVYSNLEHVATLGHRDKALALGSKALRLAGGDRGKIASAVGSLCPRYSKWWLFHVLGNAGVGPEQAADALNTAAAATRPGDSKFAALLSDAALAIAPEAQSAALSSGWLALEHGDVTKARAAFARVTRHYASSNLVTSWPRIGGAPWPQAPLDPKLFQRPDGRTEWPRISVVTPSYNQGQYIEETILSVLNQNYPNLQYIVVDGASNDGTREILERYRDRIDVLIIEPDDGQTQAINKGFKLADGELLAWLNSDDMYAPGALHMAAWSWMQTQADVIAGICLEHSDRKFATINKPAAKPEEFTIPTLADIFRYWLRGHFFYQPEVFFSRCILQKVGLLDESLHYTMDYDLWMRFAAAGATLKVSDWPHAFFRKHAAQKTSALADTVEEQARVRDRYHTVQPGEQRRAQIGRMLEPLREKKPLRVGILTKRIGKIFSKNMQEELDLFCGPDYACYLSDDERDPGIEQSDLVILIVHVLNDLEIIRALRVAKPDRPIIGWFWDNHHHLFENHAAAEALDIVIPGHAIYGEYLRNEHAIHGPHVPLCVTQWTRQDTAQWFEEFGAKDRSPALYGGFVDYAFEPQRMEFLQSAMKKIPEHALRILSETNLAEYFGRSEKERFEEWCRYQTSLVLPLRNDLSQRVFDALLAGQIPLVPEEIRDLDLVIPRDLQEKLPIIRFSMRDFKSCEWAYEQSTKSFEKDGHAGCLRRHQFALQHHTFSSMIRAVLMKTLDVPLL